MNKFSENLRYLRNRDKIGQKELAKKLEISNSMLSVWENDKNEPTLSNIIKLCKFFNVTAGQLIGLEDLD